MNRGIVFGGGVAVGIVLALLIQPVVFAPAIAPVFSPEDGHEIVELFEGAERSIDIEVYVFTSRDIVEALERAKARGVEVRIILERDVLSGENDEIYHELLAKGFNARFASEAYKLTHAKFAIVDGKAVLVGSHNFSNSALYFNREASVIIRDEGTVHEFEDAFETDWAIAS